MKVEKINDELLSIFLNIYYFKKTDINNKLELINIIKELLNKVENRFNLNLNGFYKINVYPNKKLGVFLDLIKIDDNEFTSGADFRIVIHQNEKFYLETDNYEDFKYIKRKKYFNRKFYINIEDLKNITKEIDLGNIIYGNDIKNILKEAKNVK